MSLKIQIASDIHAEFWSSKTRFNFIKPSAPILALLGDTCCVGSDDDFDVFKRFINEHIDSYNHIIIIAGNHEYYFNPPANSPKPKPQNTMSECDKKIYTFCKTSPKLHYLNNNTMTLTIKNKQYLIIGSVLWSHIPTERQADMQNMMSDYKYIYVKDPKSGRVRNVLSSEISSIHDKNVKYIKSKLEYARKKGMKAIVFSHHKPYLKPDHDALSYDPAYESDLKHLFKKPLLVWCYGHTHIKDNSTISGVQMISNPKGYPRQQTKFSSVFVISV